MRLDRFDNSGFDRGKPVYVEVLWRVLEGVLFGSWIPGSAWRVALLRLFGATVGEGVVIKPRVRVKFPWKLRVGDHSWIGESAWIDNLDEVHIGAHCCLSQGAYLCTGNHRWDEETFDLTTAPVRLENHCWVGAHARLAPGVTCHEGAVITLGSVAGADLDAWTVYGGTPASPVKQRPQSTTDGDD